MLRRRLRHLAHLLSAARMPWLGPCWRLSLPTANHADKFTVPRGVRQHTDTCSPQPSSIVFLTLVHSVTPGTALWVSSPETRGPVGSLLLINLFLSVDFPQGPPACLAFPASSDSASVGLRAAMRGRSVTASSQHTPSSPPSPPSSSSHRQGSTGCCLSADSYPPAATLNLGSATASPPR